MQKNHPTAAVPDSIERIATATVREYARGLRSGFALPMPPEGATGARYVIEWQGAQAEVDLATIEDFEIGGLRLARLSVDLRFTAGDAPARAALLERLDRYQQRGGG